MWRTESRDSASAPPESPARPPAGHKAAAAAFRAAGLLRRLSYLASVHHQDAICARHGVDAVGDGEHGAVPEGFLDGALDQGVRLRVDGRCRLVQKDDLLAVWKVKQSGMRPKIPFQGNAAEQIRRWQVKSTPYRLIMVVRLLWTTGALFHSLAAPATFTHFYIVKYVNSH